MSKLFASISAALLGAALLTGVPASAQSRDDQGEARRAMEAGNQLSLREIEAIVMPTMPGWRYLGPAYDATARAYRLKFIKDGRVVFVDVDARTGRVIGRKG
ncbi:MAG TPA: PepSY domain-containing protein [Sphingomonadaceae bacterium]|nr:PepSY domain-containing protein [Sphingomonadaceae bacterium]